QFTRAIDALEMARRLSWARNEPIEAVSVPGDYPHLCALQGCSRLAAKDSTLCCRHRDMGYTRAVEELSAAQIAEAALHAAREDSDADVLELLAEHFEMAEDSDAT